MKTTPLFEYVDLFAKQRVGVLGDVMLDKYVWGRTTRISQEAPVPVVQVKRCTSVPGGAANVARNVLSLGGKVNLFGVLGKDADGDELRGHLEKAGASVNGLLAVAGRPTTVKTRVLAGNQQVVRVDYEETSSVSFALRRRMMAELEKTLTTGKVGALILEDYAKGLFSKNFMQSIVDYATEKGIMTTLDPHPNNAFNVKGLTLMTPNRSEAFALAGIKYTSGGGDPLKDKVLQKVASAIFRRWNPRYLLITLGADGMALFKQDGSPTEHIPTRARQVFDVSGAGDTVMATMVLGMLAGASPMDAARIANYAAGVVVGMVGTAAIEADVLKNEIIASLGK